MLNINIRKVKPDEVAQLQRISKRTFYDTFAAQNDEENMRLYLDEAFSEQALTNELNEPNAEFYFAVHEENIIGYLKINFEAATPPHQTENALEIQRLYVLQAFHGKQVGQLLHQKAVEIAKRLQASSIWLGVWEKNHKAIAFYEKSGFVKCGSQIFTLGNDLQTDIIMKLPLQPE